MNGRLTALVAAGWMAVPTAAHAIDITAPPNQSGVTEGRAVAVAGRDCPGGEAVRVFFTAAPQKSASTTSRQDGSWSVDLPVPRLALGDVEEASEQSIAAECAGERDVVVVAYNRAGGDEDELPYTGPATTPAAAAVGALLVAVGAGLACSGGRRDVHHLP